MSDQRLVYHFMGDRSQLDATVKGVRSSLGGIVSYGKAALGGLLGAFAAVKSIGLADEQIASEKKLAAVFRATKNAAGLSADEIKKYAAERQNLTNFGDEKTIDAAAILGTFREVRGELFTEALGLSQDMSSVLGGDLTSATMQLGKALNDPIRGVTALRRAGVSFNEQQLEQIRLMQQSGDLAGAQRIVLDELRNEFGGAAEEMRSPWQSLMNTIGDFGEEVGKFLRPAISALDWLAQKAGELRANVAGAVVELFSGVPADAKSQGVANFRLLDFDADAFQKQLDADKLGTIEGLLDRASSLANRSQGDRSGLMFRMPWDGTDTLSAGQQLEDLNKALGVVAEETLAARTEAETYQALLSKLGTIEATSDLTATQTEWIAEARGNLERLLDEVTGGSAKIRELEMAISNVGRDPIDIEIDKLGGLGVAADDLQRIADLMHDLRAAGERETLAGQVEDLRKEIAIARGEASEADFVGSEFAALDPAELDELRELTGEKQSLDAAKRFRETIRTPFDEFRDAVAEAEKLRDGGFLDPDEALAGITQARERFLSTLPEIEAEDPARRTVDAMQLGAAETTAAIARALSGGGGDRTGDAIAKSSAATAKFSADQLAVLERVESLLARGTVLKTREDT